MDPLTHLINDNRWRRLEHILQVHGLDGNLDVTWRQDGYPVRSSAVDYLLGLPTIPYGVLEMLLRRGADWRCFSQDEISILELAVWNSNAQLLRFVLDHCDVTDAEKAAAHRQAVAAGCGRDICRMLKDDQDIQPWVRVNGRLVRQ